MRFRLLVATTVAGVCALILIPPWGGADSVERGASADIIRSVDVRLDRRCQVAVFEISLTRDAPLGLRLVGRVPFGRQRGAQLPIDLPAAGKQRGSTQAGVQQNEVWDLVYPNGDYLKPGRHHGLVRAFDSKRENVLDTYPVTLTIPSSFYTRSLDRCGG